MAKKSMPWFRLYVEMPADRKIRRLKVEHRWLWVCVLCAARSSPIHGLLLVADGVPCDELDLADMSGLSQRQVAAGLQAMAALEMLHLNDEVGCWEVAGWDGRQFASDTSTDRVRAHRERSKKKPVAPVETLHGTTDACDGNASEQSRADVTPPAPPSPVENLGAVS